MTVQDVLYYLIWAGLFFLMMRYGCGAHIMGHDHHHSSSRRDQGTGKSGDNGKVVAQANDPVCGTMVQTSKAKTAAHLGQIYYFCSETCRHKFQVAPDTYLKTGNGSSPAQEITCAS